MSKFNGRWFRFWYGLSEDQEEVINALVYGHFEEMKPKSDSGTTYVTETGLTFTWLHGLGDGKDVLIIQEQQPEWFARQVRLALER